MMLKGTRAACRQDNLRIIDCALIIPMRPWMGLAI
ncbi:hypothetical protein FHS19_003620 [Paenibacillus rhizosphaerae]|uniref:Uncharacterized protein n=1 Tax=Paenibacillus rhizosphaerae TaxID=297318 RepID=A0A839TQA5_9BACL|nr:hypothetical protein [Paenibacillus rhizosphaerae]